MKLRLANSIGIIGLKVAILTSLLVAIVASVVGYWVYDAAIDELINHERVDLRDETALRGHEILATFASLRTDILSLTAEPSLRAIVRARQVPDGERVDSQPGPADQELRLELARAFRRMCFNGEVDSEGDGSSSEQTISLEEGAKPYLQVRLIEIVGPGEGRELVRVERVDSASVFRTVEPSVLDSDERYEAGLREYVLAAENLGPHEVFLSDIRLSREPDPVTGEERVISDRPTLGAAVCIRDDSGEPMGLLVINLDLSEVYDDYLRSARHMVFLTDERGNFLLHPEPRLEFAWEKRELPEFRGDYPDPDEELTLRREAALYTELARPVRSEAAGADEGSAPTDAEWSRFYSPHLNRDNSLIAETGYNLSAAGFEYRGEEGLLLPGYPFQLRRYRLEGDWDDAAWDRLKDKLRTLRRDHGRNVMIPNPDRLIAGSTRVLSVSASLDDEELLSEVERELLSIPGVEWQYTENCRAFYASFIRLQYDWEHPERFLGLVMAFSQDEMYADLAGTKLLVVWSVAGFVLLAVVVAIGFSYMLTRRLKLVTVASESIAKGDFSVALPIESRDEIGDLARGFQHMIREVQGRERTIEEREVRLRMIVDGAAEGIITIDPDGAIRSRNSAAARMFGRENQTNPARHVRDLLAESAWEEFNFTLKRLLVEGASSGEIPALDDDSSTFRQLLRNRRATTESLSIESIGRRPDGEEFPIELSLSTVRLPEQRVVTLITRDITQRKRHEEQIQQLNEELERRNENLEQGVRERTAELEAAMLQLREARDKAQELAKAKDAFLASVSHELRNPLNQVSGFCQLLELSELDREQHEDVRKIRVANDQLLALINDILDYQKIIMGGLTLEPESLDVQRLLGEVRDATSVLPNPNRNQFYVEWSDDVGDVYADKQRLRQILLNLVGNAWKFTREGSVHLSAARRRGETGEWIEFTVQDTGRGMTPEEQSRLFRPFTKLASRKGNESGTGLGLVISRGLCTLMRGDITLRSEFGKGSSFTVRLPATAHDVVAGLDTGIESPDVIARAIEEPDKTDVSDAQSDKTPAVERDPAGDRGRLVLVIDDDPAVREMMERHLRSHGFDVVTAGSGFEGLELARSLKPAVITLDAVMPGLDGWAVLGALKAGEDTSSIPVIMVTVMDREDRGRVLGATEFLPKPIDWEQLTETLSRYTGDKRDRSILIVDDDVRTREIIRRSLETDGWHVVEAENGKEALERLAEERPAAVLLDLMMPIMDGFEFIVNYSQVAEWLSIPVLVLTAKDPTPDERARLEGQVVRVLRKGDYTHDELLAEIHRRVDRHLKHQVAGGGDEDGADSDC